MNKILVTQKIFFFFWLLVFTCNLQINLQMTEDAPNNKTLLWLFRSGLGLMYYLNRELQY